jgi:tetratricopeptide (TPR) repeat protein
MTNKVAKTLISVFLFYPGIVGNLLISEYSTNLFKNGFLLSAEEKEPKRKTRKTPAMRERIYSQLARAQKLADDKKTDEGIEVLNRVKGRINQLNSYEKAMLWNFYGFIYYGKEDSVNAIKSFEKVIEQTSIPESLELSTLFSLAQLNMADEKYEKTIAYLKRWQLTKGGKLDSNALVLKANALYAMKNYIDAEKTISNAVLEVVKAGKKPKENWLVLKRALHYELKQTEAMVKVSEELVRDYSKEKYWIELANMYGEVGKTGKQLAVMEAAHQQGFVTKRIDVQTLAQLYFLSGAPYKSAKLLSESISSGLVLENIKILNYLAQAWISAKEIDKAIPVLIRAANMSKSGNLDARLAEAYLDLENWEQAIKSATVANDKGNLDHPGNNGVVMGIAFFNLKHFESAIQSFKSAKKEKKQKKIAEQWLKYAEKEQFKFEELKKINTKT